MQKRETLKEIYRQLLIGIVKKEIAIELVERLSGGDTISNFFPKGLDGSTQAKIILVRKIVPRSNEKYFNFTSMGQSTIPPEQVENIIRTSNRPLAKELLIVAHELGHSISQNKKSGVDRVYKYLHEQRSNNEKPQFRSLADKYIVLKEEITAWRNAQVVLRRLGFKSTPYFKQVYRKSLKTYCTIPISPNSIEKKRNTWGLFKVKVGF